MVTTVMKTKCDKVEGRIWVCLESSDVRAGGTLGSVEVTQTTMTLLFQLALFEQAEVVSSGLWRELGEDREVCPT